MHSRSSVEITGGTNDTIEMDEGNIAKVRKITNIIFSLQQYHAGKQNRSMAELRELEVSLKSVSSVFN